MTVHGVWSVRALVAVGFAAGCFALSLALPFNGLDRLGYDAGMRLSNRAPDPRVVVVAIDEQTVAKLGAGGWSRNIDAQVIDNLAAAGAKAIGYAAYFPNAAADPAAEQISRLDALVQGLGAQTLQQMPQLGEALNEARRAADADGRFAQSLARAGNVILPVRLRLSASSPATGSPLRADALEVPVLPRFADASAGVGHFNQHSDQDGILRRVPLVVSYEGEPLPSFALQVVSRALGFDGGDLVLNLGRDVRLGEQSWETDEHLNLATYFYRDAANGGFVMHSFVDVYHGVFAVDAFRDKVVLVGALAGPSAAMLDTPRERAMPETLVLTQAMSTLLQGDAPRTPGWGRMFLAVMLVVCALYLALWLPRMRTGTGLATTCAALLAIGGIQLFLMAVHLLWVPVAPALCLLAVGHPIARLRRSAVEAAPAAHAETAIDATADKRILALAHQGQGHLDLAFEQFKQCAMNAKVKDNVYNLGLDYERRRQFNKAQAVFDYLAMHDPKFRDLEQRGSRHKRMLDTSPSMNSLPGLDSVTARSLVSGHLGRYEIEREIGKGAMGVVYLGRDPKIGRTVAIKTLALSSEFEAEELEQVRQRFFREAETAGRLIHPNIVTIFDAGEDQDLAYFAMEFLSGTDLSAHVKPETLLPLPVVISIVARVADALDYAHRKHVVHRDVKPGNIMYDASTDTVKVTDFGVARITDSSKTKTGIVLGTPSFMSPEQLAGQKIDGQSDLFSLGVTLYQLCCGALPFKGDSMAQLMYRIANEPPVDPVSLNRDLPEGVVAVLNRALAKQKQDRFASGAEMAEALRTSQTMFTSVDLAL